MKTEELRKRVAQERYYQDDKWGKQNHSPEKWIVILAEEFGEVAQAVNLGNNTRVTTELIQITAVIEAWLTMGEPNDDSNV